MDIILTKKLKSKGEAGDLIRVKPGFARNFLIPQGIAVPATKAYRNQHEQIKKRIQKEREERHMPKIILKKK